MRPSIANMCSYYTVAFTLQGITSCEVFTTKAIPISNIDDPGKVPYYVTEPAIINQILVLDEALQIKY